MSNNMNLMSDSTGSGMAGAEDMSLVAQQNLKKTIYNGTKNCTKCGTGIDPYMGMHQDKCTPCRNAAHAAHLKNRMAP